jgi:hypothetical protein
MGDSLAFGRNGLDESAASSGSAHGGTATGLEWRHLGAQTPICMQRSGGLLVFEWERGLTVSDRFAC